MAACIYSLYLCSLSVVDTFWEGIQAYRLSIPNYSGPATVAEVPYMECLICKRKYHVETEMRVAIIYGFLSSDSTRRNC